MIKKNNQTIGGVFKGTTEIGKIMFNNVVVYESWKELTANGVPPINLQKCKNAPMIDYKIYGETVQNGTPSWTNPIEYESVGDLVTDSSDTNYGKYKIPVLVNNTPTNIYLNEPLRRVSDGVTEHIDYIDFENQKVVRNCMELVVTGYESNWEQIGSSDRRLYRFKISVEQLGPGAQTTFPDQFCNYAECKVVSSSGTEIGASVYHSPSLNGTFFRIRPGTTYSTFTAFLNKVKSLYDNGNPIKIVFFISTPTEESIVLPDIALNRGTNIVDVDTSITPSNMFVKYKGK